MENSKNKCNCIRFYDNSPHHKNCPEYRKCENPRCDNSVHNNGQGLELLCPEIGNEEDGR